MSLLRVWDMRRGDYDDNRSSPYGSGFRGLVLSTALEFNYLKAPLSFIMLIIIPALIVGIAPSIVVTYWYLLRQTAILARSQLIVAIIIWAALGFLAFWLGWRLISTTFSRFRHLHYTLVFPIFVALREVLRMCAERLGGRTMTPSRLVRMRSIGTLIAALLFALGGLALAILVEFTFGPNLVEINHATLWTTIRATLTNAAVILGVSTTLESLYWMWRELTVGPAVRDWVPTTSQNGGPVVRVAHLSDLHLVGERYGFRMETGTHGPRGNRSFHTALRKLAAMNNLNPIDRVLVTGDVTDAGTRGEWAAFMDRLRANRELGARFFFVPGNHDVNIVDRTNPGRLDLPLSAGPALRKLRFVLALDAVQGDRVYLVDRGSRGLGSLLRDYLRDSKRVSSLRSLAQSGDLRGRWEMTKAWDEIFPLVEPPRSKDSYGVILLDSNAPSHFSLTNAIGFVNPSQLKALKSVLRNSSGYPWIILLHHQVVEYPVADIPLRDRIGLALVNAPDVLAAIAPYASRVLVLHGHRHRDWIGTCGGVVLCSAPSLALESAGVEESRGSFHVHELLLRSNGDLCLKNTERIKVS